MMHCVRGQVDTRVMYAVRNQVCAKIDNLRIIDVQTEDQYRVLNQLEDHIRDIVSND